MNLTLTNLNQAPAAARNAAPVAANETAAPAVPAATAATGRTAHTTGTAPAPMPAPEAAQAAPQPAVGFAQWLGLDQLAAPLADAPAAADAALAQTDTPADEQEPASDTPLMGAMAMAMPLMPVAQATLAAVVAALPGVPAAKEPAPAADTDISLPAGAAGAQGQGAGRDGRIELAAAPALPQARAADTAAAAAASAAAPKAAAGLPAEAVAFTAHADASQEQAAPAVDRGAANTMGVAAPAPGASQRTADTVTLSGPPTAWRQTLQEALGDRLQLQVGKGAEQAVIRLEPPMLGRVEIAIRHSAGSLEVHISATHGEVLRQLQTVSEGLRNDLAQRQFTDVAVNVAAAPRGANAAPMFSGGDGRGRQQDARQQEQDPGQALAEANAGSTPFSLNGRGQNRA